MSEVNELEQLKEQAKQAGIGFKSNVTVNQLKKLLAEQYNQDSIDEQNQARFDLEKENMRLVHVIITPMDSTKHALHGEFFSAGNAVLGTVTRFVPFNKSWLIENMLLKTIREKEFQLLVPRTIDGKETQESIIKPAYAIQELALPTPEEVAELARQQQARQSVE